MGRTNPTYRDVLGSIEDAWSDYRRGLRHATRRRFDRLFEYARSHADAAGYLNHTEPMYPVFLSVDLEQQRRIDELEDRLETLEAELDRTGSDGG